MRVEQLRLVVKHMVVSQELFFFQAEDGIRDYTVTGVQTCALPIYIRGHCLKILPREVDLEHPRRPICSKVVRDEHSRGVAPRQLNLRSLTPSDKHTVGVWLKIGRASCKGKSVGHG